LKSEPVLKVVRRELRILSPDVKVSIDDLKASIEQEVLKRDVVFGDEADEAKKKVKKMSKRKGKAKDKKQNNNSELIASSKTDVQGDSENEGQATISEGED
jgi:hypothetical protein